MNEGFRASALTLRLKFTLRLKRQAKAYPTTTLRLKGIFDILLGHAASRILDFPLRFLPSWIV